MMFLRLLSAPVFVSLRRGRRRDHVVCHTACILGVPDASNVGVQTGAAPQGVRVAAPVPPGVEALVATQSGPGPRGWGTAEAHGGGHEDSWGRSWLAIWEAGSALSERRVI